jgi:hypothetical protein
MWEQTNYSFMIWATVSFQFRHIVVQCASRQQIHLVNLQSRTVLLQLRSQQTWSRWVGDLLVLVINCVLERLIPLRFRRRTILARS